MTSTPALPEFRGALAPLVATWRNDPVKFACDVYNFDPDDWQVEVLKSLVTCPHIMIRSGNGAGKSALFVMAMAWRLITRFPSRVILTSGKREQVTDVFWPEWSLWQSRRNPNFPFIDFKKTEDKICLVGAEDFNMVLPRTSGTGKPDTMHGHHAASIMALVDEAFAVDRSIFHALLGAMTTEDCVFLAGGNPTTNSGFAADCFKPGSPWKTFTIDCRKVKHVKPGFVEFMAKEFNKDGDDSHPEWRARVLGLPPLADQNQAISTLAIEKAMQRVVHEPTAFREHWGLDVGGPGKNSDRTALSFRAGHAQTRPTRVWRGVEHPRIQREIEEIWHQSPRKPRYVFVDANGIGLGIYQYLRTSLRSSGTSVVGVNVSEAALDRGRYKTQRDELWGRAKEWVESPTSKLIDQGVANELQWAQCEHTPDGRWRISSKAAYSDSSHASPDLADSFVLTFACRDVMERDNSPLSNAVRSRRAAGTTWMANA